MTSHWVEIRKKWFPMKVLQDILRNSNTKTKNSSVGKDEEEMIDLHLLPDKISLEKEHKKEENKIK